MDKSLDFLKKYNNVKKASKIVVSILRFLILVSIGYVIIYPLMYMITTSFRTGPSYYDPTITWITTKVSSETYSIVISATRYWKSLWNTISMS